MLFVKLFVASSLVHTVVCLVACCFIACCLLRLVCHGGSQLLFVRLLVACCLNLLLVALNFLLLACY
jgi:hypothetical protein